jgi:hypothetical protein
MRLSPLGNAAIITLLYQTQMVDDDDCGVIWQGKPKYSEKTFPNNILYTKNPTLPDPGSNPGRRDG